MQGLLQAVQPINIAYLFGGSVLGILIGAAPGLGPVFGLAILLSMTFSMTPAGALIFLSAVYASCVYGGSITAILLNTPGTPGSVATTFDGFALSKRGEAGRALGISTMASGIGGIIGVLSLAVLGPPLAQASLLIGPPEFFVLAVAGLCLVSLAAKGNTIKGIIMGGFGLMLSFVGRSVVTGQRRFVFDTIYLEDGIQFVPMVIGLFAFAQAMVLANEEGAISEIKTNIAGVWKGCMDVFKNPVTTLRSSVLGTIIGIVPGLGINAANFIAYVVEKNASKEPETFGQGNVKGIIAPESANNAVTSSALIPAFGLGVPGSSTAALFLSAMMIHGLQPGHNFFTSGNNLFSTIVWGMLLAQVVFVVLGLAFAKYFAQITRVPNSILVPFILGLSVVGSFALRVQLMDVVIMLVAGVVGYYLQKYDFPLACLILGIILGPLAEDNFMRSMRISRNDLSIFVTRPISLAFVLLIVVSFLWPVIKTRLPVKKAA
jgi:putative tricarboxylic transport membrane protein